EAVRGAALSTLLSTQRLQGERDVRAEFAGLISTPGDGRRTIYDCKTGTNLALAKTVRTENGPASSDASVNRAFDGFGQTRKFFKTVLRRNSIDNKGMRLDGFVHRGLRYNNAFWDGQRMVFGDGDGVVFTDFTSSLDVIAHELTHGVTEFAAGLEYHNQSGALNESMSDVFGSLVKQWSLGQSVDEADWLIGSEVFTPGVDADALRSMKAPGTAYDNPMFGKDPQPGHMRDFVKLPDNEDGDWGGVHINSGIPNKAFFVTAMEMGGRAWDKAGPIWYAALLASQPTTGFQEFANTTFVKAGLLHGSGSGEQKAVAAGWKAVGIDASGTAKVAGGEPTATTLESALEDVTLSLSGLAKRLQEIATDVHKMASNGDHGS
ncbi:MAG TPA: M4 family metallopeptidase, partial [Polyangia bacterium]